MSQQHIAIYARTPKVGTTKTRLAGALGFEGACAIYEAFVRDTLDRVRGTGVSASLWLTGEHPAPFHSGGEFARHQQAEGDLGARMEHTIDHLLGKFRNVVVVGTDAPTLPADLLPAAFRALDSADHVLSPAADGGYCLIGARKPVHGALKNVRWSSRHARADTVNGLSEAGRSVAFTRPWYDIDTPADLGILRTHLRLDPTAAPHTARFLGL